MPRDGGDPGANSDDVGFAVGVRLFHPETLITVTLILTPLTHWKLSVEEQGTARHGTTNAMDRVSRVSVAKCCRSPAAVRAGC